MARQHLGVVVLGYASLLLLASLVLLLFLNSVETTRIRVHRFTPEFSEASDGVALGELVSRINETRAGELLNGRRKLLGSASNGGFRASLVRHRPNSSNLTRTEFFYEAARRSKARAKALAAGIGRSSSSASTTLDFQSPVASANGAYTMEIQLGTPPQKFSAILDTGSDLVWVQCRPCTQCYSQKGALFNPSASSTFAKTSCTTSACQGLPVSGCSSKGNTCLYGYQYGDSSSTQGDFALETLTLVGSDGGKTGFPGFEFGCGRLNSGSFGGAAGIVGLGQGPISLATQLGSAINNKFSYCLVDFDDDASKTSPLLLGSSAAISGSSISTPIIPNSARSTYYFVGLEGVSVGGKSLSLSTKLVQLHDEKQTKTKTKIHSSVLEVNSGGTIFDSGTTLTLFDDSVYSKVKSAFSGAISLPSVDGSSAGFDLCYDISSNKNYKFPSLTLSFKGASFTPPQANYFVIVDTAGKVACLAMGGSGSLGLGIIGNLMQQNYHVLYDRSTGTLSMAPAQCDSL